MADIHPGMMDAFLFTLAYVSVTGKQKTKLKLVIESQEKHIFLLNISKSFSAKVKNHFADAKY